MPDRSTNPNPEPIFRHLDDPDVPWIEVKKQRNADGSQASVREKWLAFNADPPYLSLYARYDPHMIVRQHGHRSPHVLFVIDGEIWCGGRLCRAGTHIELREGATFGPFRAGDDGATLFEVMLGDPRSWGVDEEAFTEFLARWNVEALPDPPLDLPVWVEDSRSEWERNH